jgi:phosphoglycerate kinase
LTGCEVLLPEDCIGDAPKKVIHDLRVAAAGGGGRVTPQICLLENLRFHAGEEQDDESFARALGELCDVYVDDAFGAMHRAHASVHGLPRLKEDRGAGFLVMREIEALEKLVKSPARPYAALLGGVKVSDKIDVIEALLGRCDRICIGGAMANTFLAAEGHNMQRSLVEQDKLPLARTLISKAEQAGVALLLPNDVVVGESLEAKIGQAVAVHEIPDGTMALDIGPDTVSRFGKALSDARTIFWNGPMGVFESAAFSKGTFGMARLLSGVRGFTVVGGGDSAAAVHQAGGDLADKFDHISTGGGASLTFIEGKRMPGIEALRHRTIDDDR